MATVYFTNNADSGDGSLRAALAAASPGDVVTYSDSAFADTDEIVILLSSELVPLSTKEITIDGREKRIVLDGQSVTRLLRCASTDITLPRTYINIDFINGYSDSYKAPINITRATSTFKRCRILGGTSSVSNAGINVEYLAICTMEDCLISGCNRTGVNIGSSEHNIVIVKRCTIVGNVIDISVNNASTANSITDCLIHTKTGPGSADIIVTLPSTCGFVAPCPDVIDPASWNNALWQSWDFRLTPESPYLAGAETVEAGAVDILGHDRKENGAFGAYEGSWIIAPSVIDANTTVDYVDAPDNTTLNFVDDVFLTATLGATVGAATFTGSGYFATPAGTDVSAATFDGVVACDYGANVTSFTTFALTDTSVGFTIEKTGTANVLLERKLGTNWRIVSTDATNETIDENVGGQLTYRVFDGVNFFVSSVMLPTTFWTIKCWAVAKTNGGSEDKPFVVSSWALDPEID